MNEKSKKAIDFAGFPDAGIANLESEIKQQQAIRPRTPEARPRTQPQSKPTGPSEPSTPSPLAKTGSEGGIVWLGVLGAFVIFAFWVANQDTGTGRTTDSSSTTYNPPSTSRPQQLPAPEQALLERAPPEDRDAILSIEEARYCVFWRARIERMEDLAVHEPLREPLQQYYDKYNSECVKRRFRDNYDRAMSELEVRRNLIEQDAVEIVNSWKPTYLAPVVRSVQEDLNYLGYDAGPTDGLYGPKTRDAILQILRAAGREEDARITYSLRDELRQVTTSLRNERSASDIATNNSASDGPRKWFGLVKRASAEDMQFIETTEVPKIPGQAYGWFIYVGETDKEVHWTEKYSMPSPLPSWEDIESLPYVVISADRTVVTTQRWTMPQDGYLFNFWSVADNDPIGIHSIVVTIGNRQVESFTFELVDP